MSKHYFALTQIKHDGKDYGVGDELILDQKQADLLIDAGAVSDTKGMGKAGGAPDADHAPKAKK